MRGASRTANNYLCSSSQSLCATIISYVFGLPIAITMFYFSSKLNEKSKVWLISWCKLGAINICRDVPELIHSFLDVQFSIAKASKRSHQKNLISLGT